MSQQKPNTGTLFKNDPAKKKSDQSPDYGGAASVTCPHCSHQSDWRLAGWVNESKSQPGRKFIGLTFNRPQAKGGA